MTLKSTEKLLGQCSQIYEERFWCFAAAVVAGFQRDQLCAAGSCWRDPNRRAGFDERDQGLLSVRRRRPGEVQCAWLQGGHGGVPGAVSQTLEGDLGTFGGGWARSGGVVAEIQSERWELAGVEP